MAFAYAGLKSALDSLDTHNRGGIKPIMESVSSLELPFPPAPARVGHSDAPVRTEANPTAPERQAPQWRLPIQQHPQQINFAPLYSRAVQTSSSVLPPAPSDATHQMDAGKSAASQASRGWTTGSLDNDDESPSHDSAMAEVALVSWEQMLDLGHRRLPRSLSSSSLPSLHSRRTSGADQGVFSSRCIGQAK